MSAPRFAVIGAGRAGRAFAGALARSGWVVDAVLGRDDDPASAARSADVVLITTPDSVIGDVAGKISPRAGAVVAHAAGSLTLEVLAGHERVASVHPLMSLPAGDAGVDRLRSGGWFAVAGDPMAVEVVDALGGRSIVVGDPDRALYHAAASIASNHLVALLGQVERLADHIGVPFEAYLDLARGSFESVAATGPAVALTGPAARGDEATVAAHLRALPVAERAAYVALMREARRLATASGPAGAT